MKKLLLTIVLLGMINIYGKAVEYEIYSTAPERTAVAWITPGLWDDEIIEQSVIIKRAEYTVTRIKKNPWYQPDQPFNYYYSASLVYIPSSVKYIEKDAFYGFQISKFEFEGDEPLEEVGDYAFGHNGIGLKYFNLDVLPGNPEKLGRGLFRGTRIDSISGGSHLTVIPDLMFSSSYITNFDFSPDLQKVGKYAFYACELHKNLSLPDNVILAKGAFKANCLTGITLGDNVSVGPEAFRENLSVDFIELGRGCKLDSCSFGPNYLVKELSIPEGTTLGTASFNAFVGLESVHIADDVIFAGEKCFTYRFSNPSGPIPDEFYETEPKPLTVYYHTGTPQYTEADQFDDLTYEEGCLYVYPDGVEAARTTYPWSRFKTILPMDIEVGMKTMETAASITDDTTEEVYTLDGLRVGTSTEGLSPGVYIVRQGARTRKVAVR